MAKIYIPAWDEQFTQTLREKGLGVGRNAPHWLVARLALSKSLQMPQFPAEELTRPLGRDRAREIHMEQMTGENTTVPGKEDLTDAFCLLLSMYHDEDLFKSRERFIDLLQRHVQRGLQEIQASWREGNDFFDYLYHDLFFERTDAEVPDETQATRLARALGELGVGSEIDDVVEGPRLTRYILRLTAHGDLDRLKRNLDKVPFELGLSKPVTLVPVADQRRVALDIPRPESTWHPVKGTSLAEWVKDRPETLPLCPGTDVLGQPVVLDLAEAPHLFVAGTTGSGKSVCVHALLVSLLASGRSVRLALIDPKEVEFAIYGRCRVLWGDRVITEMAEAGETLAGLVEEMDRRQKELAALGVANVAEAQAKGADLPRIVVVVDELADLLMQRPDSEDSLIRLAQKARAVGIHLILATQRPGSDTFPGLLRSNVPTRIALTVRSSAESRIILDETGAEKLLMRGDMRIRFAGKPTVRAHGAWVDHGDIRACLR